MCLSLYRSGSAIDYNKDVYRLEDDCSGSRETFTLGPFGAFSLDIRPSQIATVSESGDTSREVNPGPSPLDGPFAIPEIRESELVLPHEDLPPGQPQTYEGQSHASGIAVPDLIEGNTYGLSLESFEGSGFDVDLVWQDLGWQQSPANLFDGLDQSTIEAPQNAFAITASDTAHIQNELMTIESTCLRDSLSRLGNDPLPHLDTLLELFKDCYARPGSSWQILQMPAIQRTVGQIALKVQPSTASSAVLLAVLAVMSFHMDRLNTTETRTGYWWHVGEDYMTQALTRINPLLEDDPPLMDNARYKMSLMALLTVVAVCVSIKSSCSSLGRGANK